MDHFLKARRKRPCFSDIIVLFVSWFTFRKWSMVAISLDFVNCTIENILKNYIVGILHDQTDTL
jgi:hypothetical protein